MFFGFGSPNVLVIDDDESLQRLIKARLEGREKVNVTCALTGEDGFNKAVDNKPDMIILDWVLPNIQGPDVLLQLKAQESTKNIPVLMLTGRNKIGEIEETFSLGTEAYLTKPFSLQTLGEKVINILSANDE